MTPIIGVTPTSLDFGSVALGSCDDAMAFLANDASDPQSLLNVSEITVTGSAFSLFSGPTLPVTIPGDTSTVQLLIRFCPIAEGPNSGTLTIVATNAANSPYSVPLSGVGTEGGLEFMSTQLLIDFTPAALAPPYPLEGPVEGFGFRTPGLREALQIAGVARLRKLLPAFTPESVNDTTLSGEPVQLNDMSRIYVGEISPGTNILQALGHLRQRPGIAYAEPDFLYRPDYAPRDPLFGVQWGAENTGSLGAPFVAGYDINAAGAWEQYDPTFASEDIGIAILDTGLESAHEDLPLWFLGPNYTSEWPFDYSPISHGTAVMGIIQGIANNDKGIAGMCWRRDGGRGAWAWNVKVHSATEWASASILAQALDWVRTNPPTIASVVMGTYGWSTPLYYATLNVAKVGKFIVSGMGDYDSAQPRFPAAHDYTTFAVGAFFGDGQRWVDTRIPLCPYSYGSTHGSWIDVVAPGGRAIATTKRRFDVPDPMYYDLNPRPPQVPSWCEADGFTGTSAAAAFGAGTAALLSLAALDNVGVVLEGDDLAHILRETASHPNGPGSWDQFFGRGRLQADRAVSWVGAGVGIDHRQSGQLTAQEPLPEEFWDIYNVPGLASGSYRVFVYGMRGRINYTIPFAQVPDNWYRVSGTVGWPYKTDGVYNYNIDPTSYAQRITNTLGYSEWMTFMLKVHNVNGQFVGWFPCAPEDQPCSGPEHARIAITALGINSAIAVGDAASAIEPVAHATVAPNPSVGVTRFLVDIPRESNVSVRIYDLGGRMVGSVADRMVPAGAHVFEWDGSNGEGRELSSGVYFYRAAVNGEVIKTDKLLLIR